MGRDSCAGVDPGVRRDVAGPFKLCFWIDNGVNGDVWLTSRVMDKRIGVAGSGHNIAMGLHVLFWCPDIDPVAAVNVGDKRVAARDE